MMWQISFIVSIIILILTTVFVVFSTRYKSSIKVSSPLTVLICGSFLAAFVIFLPICFEQYQGGTKGVVISLLAAVYNTLKVFLVDGDLDAIMEASQNLSKEMQSAYELLGIILITLSPLLTFGVVLSFFENVMSYHRYILHYFTDAYIFSELNEKSLALAESLRDSGEKCLLIFTDVFESDEEKGYELKESADEIGAICFKKDITSVNFKHHSQDSQLYFMVIGEDETENIGQALELTEIYQDCPNVRMDVFAKSMEAELLLKTKDKGKIKMIRRMNDVQSLISRILYETGEKIFEHTAAHDDQKVVSAVVVGMGQHGLEMAKGLTWFCQMIGYRFEMNIFDQDPNAAERFEMYCPDLMSENYNGVDIDGEPSYTIYVHSDVDVNTSKFRKLLGEIKEPSYVFICLGSDAQNVKTATDIRSFYAMNQFQPRIQAVLYNTGEKEALYHAKYNDSKRTQSYEIEFVGDIKTSYSSDVILNSEVEKKALERHLMWGSEESFWAYEYNYRSSIASAIHQKMKILLKVPYADVIPEKRPFKERDDLRKLEHCRWSAYVRSEGYTYGEERNDLAKKHPCLVPYEELSEEEKAKDDV